MPVRNRRSRVLVLIAATSVACLAACSSTAAKTPMKDAAAGGAVTVIPGVEVRADDALHAQLPDAIKQAGEVRVATDLPYAPFEMYADGSTTQMTGIDYDLGQALGAKLGVKFTFAEQKFDGILPAMQAGKFDVAMAGMTDKRKREAAVDFVDYSNSGTGLLVMKGNPKNLHQVTDLCGQTVAVQAGTNQEKLIQARQSVCSQAGKPVIGVQVYPKDSDAQLALRSGKVSADVIDLVAAAWTAKTADNGATFDAVTDTAAVGGSGASPNGIAVVKTLPQLSDAMTKALQELIDDGTYKKILDHYGVAAIGLAKATKNAAVD